MTALWLLPFYPSPLKDDGYDVADYKDVHSLYGSLGDFKLFLREAHRRGLRVITELVVNHTSDQHPWFQRARRAKPGSSARGYYVWSPSPDRYKDARIIFKDFEASNWTWDPVAKAYYWHRFYSHQPDLNFDHPPVRKALYDAMEFWLEMGVDGLRLDAIPYLFEREGTHCENLPETHAFLRDLRRQVDGRFKSRMLLAEANQWPEDAAAYFGEGGECHMAFHFPLMPRLFMALRMEDRFPIMEILGQTPAIPTSCQWALFLRNHDELTLEMVTDEERDYMYRVYANDPQARVNFGIRRRLAPLLGNNRRRIELMYSLLFSLPGTPVIYYGDEIGMGDNIYLGDRNAVRTPMQWSSDRNAGFSQGNPQKLYLPVIVDPEYHYEAVNVEAQQNNPHSLLWWMKRILSLRKRYKAFGRGTLEFLQPENRKVLAFVRQHEDESLLVVANLSRFVQYVELDLSRFKGMVPVEAFGRADFPAVGESPYLLTLGSHSFYWFSLERRAAGLSGGQETVLTELQALAAGQSWQAVLEGGHRAALEKLLPDFLRRQRWFGGKARAVRFASIHDVLSAGPSSCLLLVSVEYSDGEPETYSLPLTFAAGETGERARGQYPQAVLARLSVPSAGGSGYLMDAASDPGFASAMLEAVRHRRRLRGRAGDAQAAATRLFSGLAAGLPPAAVPALLSVDQSNSSIVFGRTLLLKLFRRLSPGSNPDLEIGRFLSERVGFSGVPALAGTLEYRRGDPEGMSLGVLQSYVPNDGSMWDYTLDALGQFYERVLACSPKPAAQAAADVPPPDIRESIGAYLDSAALLGKRTAELHLALASGRGEFAPEPFTTLYQRTIYQSMRQQAGQTLPALRRFLRDMREPGKAEAARLLEMEGRIQQVFRRVLQQKLSGQRIRCHGDFHLGQVLHTGKDCVIIDFEGEPARPIVERRIKRSPLRDVAGMLRSFHYAAHASLLEHVQRQAPAPEARAKLEEQAQSWAKWVGAAYLSAYLLRAESGSFLPKSAEERGVLLSAYLLEKALYELAYEMNNRPAWVGIPIRGILQLLQDSA